MCFAAARSLRDENGSTNSRSYRCRGKPVIMHPNIQQINHNCDEGVVVSHRWWRN